MDEIIEVTLDDKNHVIIPSSLQAQLGLAAGMTLVAETDDSGQLYLRILPQAESPVLVNKKGVTVVRTQPLDDLRDFVRNESDRRVETLLERTRQ
jgi:bifunctional DNA-binding transcriptional regulator/antitoxin component of YhaV-PrlF toxin-antitoxin module